MTDAYVGRFAPSPTGPLHFGSLVAALASFLDARHARGTWLLRIEDLDPPRESADAPSLIMGALEAFGLYWDGVVTRQGDHLDAYQAALERLVHQDVVFPCACARRSFTGIYPGTCRDRTFAEASTGPAYATRMRVPQGVDHFNDLFLGDVAFDFQCEIGDFVIKRKDGLFAYQLAVVVDDAAAGVTHVVRGRDLLDSTPRQRCLQAALGFASPRFGHCPVVVHPDGAKLSKQTGAPALAETARQHTLIDALVALGQPTFAIDPRESVETILAQAIASWDRSRVSHADEVDANGQPRSPPQQPHGPD